ncbi:MAG: bifunctional UDP-N-acetylmuramoyl-tripeptide:D-alanyl-D-alanine ligase/alanine racemase [Lacibacter sp.]
MYSYPFHTIAATLNGTIVQMPQPDAAIVHLYTDSRRMLHPENGLFFALQTPQRNGHAFVYIAYQKGIRNFIVHEAVATEQLPEANIVQVGNTLTALQQLAAWHRHQMPATTQVIGITGSNGKTIVKEWLYQLLHEDYRIVRSPKSYNSQLGVPLSVWEMRPEHNLALFEAGISQRGEMEALQQIIRPTMGILTNIGDAHDEGFASRHEKLQEKCRLFATAQTIIYSPQLCGGLIPAPAGTAIYTWGTDAAATLQLLQANKTGSVTHLELRWKKQYFDASLPFTDEASLQNALCCMLTCLVLGMQPAVLSGRLQRLRPVSLRLELKKGKNGCTLLNDSYSSDLHSFEAALGLLQQQTQHQHRTVIMSDLPVPAEKEAESYERLAVLFEAHRVHRVVCVGTRAARAFATASHRQFEVLPFLQVEELLQQLPTWELHNEALLIKGARSFELERLLPLLEQQVHETVLEINLTALNHNIATIRRQLRPGVKLMAVVKAFSYGSGSYEIASRLQYQGVDYLAVAFTDEGIELRKAGITLPIMVMNPEPSGFDALTTWSLEPEIYSFRLLQLFRQHVQQQGLEAWPVHLKLDTGMHRLGFMPHEVPQLAAALSGATDVRIASVFSHLTSAEDAAADAFTRQQASLFEEGCTLLQQATPYPFLRHLANSAGLQRHPHLQYEMVRSGIGLYGIGLTGGEPVLSLYTTIAQLKHLQPGDTVGYNRKGVVQRPSRIATVRMGYADGYPRNLSNGKGYMLVKGQKAPVMGTVCMDMCMLDVTDIAGVQEGDRVLVFGQALPLETLAQQAGTIPYEIMTGVAPRVKRVYYEE